MNHASLFGVKTTFLVEQTPHFDPVSLYDPPAEGVHRPPFCKHQDRHLFCLESDMFSFGMNFRRTNSQDIRIGQMVT